MKAKEKPQYSLGQNLLYVFAVSRREAKGLLGATAALVALELLNALAGITVRSCDSESAGAACAFGADVSHDFSLYALAQRGGSRTVLAERWDPYFPKQAL